VIPAQVVTFVLTEAEHDPSLLNVARERVIQCLERHRQLIREAVTGHGGRTVEGAHGRVSTVSVFDRASEAIAAAVSLQARLSAEPWEDGVRLGVRFAIHTGEGGERQGPTLNVGVGLREIAHDGQIVCSETTAALARAALPDGVELIELGEHWIERIHLAVRIFEVRHASLPRSTFEIRVDSGPRTNLMPERWSFVGREDEIRQVLQSLDAARLVTLTGVPGVGKTRLALRVGAQLLSTYRDGVWLIDLAGLVDSAAVPHAVAEILGVKHTPGLTVSDSVLSYLSNKRLLLVVDNCEHLLEPIGRLLQAVLERAPHVKVLATSRESLHLPGERAVTVLPFAVREDTTDPATLENDDAIRLFVERARAVRAGFSLRQGTADVVALLCRRLDGLPLAIELAAARVIAMTPAEILGRLDQRLDLLRAGASPTGGRHRTLREAIDWSYGLLSEPERWLLRRLSLCAGGFNLDAAEVIGAREDLSISQVVDGLGSLAGKSLLMAHDVGGESRYRMLETIREYGRDQLEAADELEETRMCHARYYVGFAVRAGRELKGPAERTWLERVERELDNLRVAVAQLLGVGQVGLALELVQSLALQGLRIEGAVGSIAEGIVSHPGADADPRYPVALAFLAWRRLRVGQRDEAESLADECVARLAELPEDPAVTYGVLAATTGVEATLGRNPGEHAEALLASARTIGDPYAESLALVMVATAKLIAGQEGAVALCEEAVRIARSSGSPSAIAYCLHAVALYSAGQDPDGALRAAEEARLFAGAALNDFALTLAEATRSALLSKSGAHQTAAGAFLQSARRAFRDGLRDTLAWSLWGVAGSVAATGRPEPAAVLKGWVESLLGPDDDLLNLHLHPQAAEALSALAGQLGKERFAQLEQTGADMSDEGVLRYAEEIAVDSADVRREDGGTIPEETPNTEHNDDRFAPLSVAFVGRDREIKQLVSTLEAAKAGRGGLVLISGEAGIGKTRLAEEIDSRGKKMGVPAFWGRCWDMGGAPAYWPWMQVLRSLVRQYGLAKAVEPPQRAALIAQILPELVENVPDLPTPLTVEPDIARFALFDAVCACLSTVANETALTIIFDDLHSADHSSLLLLQFVARAIRDQPILIVGTCRSDESSEVADLMSEIGKLGQRWNLTGLSEREVATLIEEQAGAAPSAAVATAVYQATEGNPFFVHEMTVLLEEQDSLTANRAPSRLAVPAGVRDAISRRLARLPEVTADILTVASVVGRTFDVDLIERITGGNRAQLLDALAIATRERIVTEMLRSLGRYSFTHTLIRETLYESISHERRGKLHDRVAEALQELHGADIAPFISGLAYHTYEAAVTGGDAQLAIDLSVAAGRQAAASLAYEEALAYFQRALQLQPANPHSDQRRSELLLLCAEALKAVGEGTEAKAVYARAGELARRAGDPGRLAEAALGWGGDVGLTGGLVDPGLLNLLEEALAALPDDDSTLRARLLARIALERLFAGNPEQVAQLSSRAIEVARRVSDPATLAYALHVRSFTLLGADNAENRRGIAPEIVELATAAGDVQLTVNGHGWQIQTCLELGDRAGALEAIEAIDRLTEELGQPRYKYWAEVFRTTLALIDGNLSEAERLAEEALNVGQGPFETNAPLIYGAQLFAIRREQGRLAELAELLEEFIGAQPGLPVWRAGLALARLEAGQLQAARDQLKRLANNRFASLPHDLNWLLALVLCSEVAAGLHDENAAEILSELLKPHSGRNLAVVQGIYYAGSIDYYLGILAATLGRQAEATASLEAAERAHEALGARAWLARTWYQLGRVLLKFDTERAHDVLDNAASAAREMGMHYLADQIDRDQHEPATHAAVAPTKQEAALRRDGEVWEVSYQGVTVRVRDVRGLRYLAQLVVRPGHEFHVRELLGATAEPAGAVRAVAPQSDAGPLLDARAKQAYRQRLIDLQDDLDEAEAWGDTERASRARDEMQALASQLSAAVGLGGRDRRAGSEAERARSAVTKRIHDAIHRLSAQNAALGRHLQASIRTGYFCSYMPDDSKQSWLVQE
jgi:predicted ATPase/tetratricopeptide (TPR) repeat protein